MGRPGLDAARFLIEAMELPLSPDDLLEMMDKRTVEAFKHVQPLPGIVRLVNHLEKHRIPMAVSHTLAEEEDHAFVDKVISL